MVDELYAAGGGQESAVDQFARHVESDQGIEIARMQEMLAERRHPESTTRRGGRRVRADMGARDPRTAGHPLDLADQPRRPASA